ncbi:Aspartyl/glutamyl-tRNA(Asn/Gln) amidotransferase subunit B [compost metagenome]
MELAVQLNLLIEENVDELSGFVDNVLSKYQPQVEAYKKGKKGVLGLFVGEVMKLAKGKANPQKINELLEEKLK